MTGRVARFWSVPGKMASGARSGQLGHADLGITSAYLRGIDNTEIIHTVHERPAPMIPATPRLALGS